MGIQNQWGEKKITPERCFHYQVSCFPGNMKFLRCCCSWIALSCPEIPALSCWGSKRCPEAMRTTIVGPDLDREAKGWVTVVQLSVDLFFFLLFFILRVELCPVFSAPDLAFWASSPLGLCYRTHVWARGKVLCRQVGRGTTSATHRAGWSPKELASSAFPNTIFKCQSCIKASPAMESRWHELRLTTYRAFSGAFYSSAWPHVSDPLPSPHGLQPLRAGC